MMKQLWTVPWRTGPAHGAVGSRTSFACKPLVFLLTEKRDKERMNFINYVAVTIKFSQLSS